MNTMYFRALSAAMFAALGILIVGTPGALSAIVAQTVTDPATAITASDATLNGMSGPTDSDGHSFWVSTSTIDTSSPTIPSGVYSTPDLGAVASSTSFQAQLADVTTSGVPSNMPAITPGTTYYFVAWTHPIGGSWTPGAVLNFTTLQAPAFTSSPVTSGSTGVAYSYTVTTSGIPNAGITATTTIPAGLSFTDNGDGTATLSGTPSAAGTYPVGLTATNSAGSADQSFVLTIVDPCNGWTLEGCTVASVNGQDGWKSTGSFDQGVVNNTYGIASFGAKTFRISNAVTSGSFGDQTFVKPSANEAGETDASNNGTPVGTRTNHFVEQFDIVSASTTEQTGLSISVSPDRGDGSRMSYLRFDDTTGGIDVTFYDTPGVNNPADFVPTVVATGLDRTVPHTIKFDMTFVDGPDNDVVKIYIDGTLVHTGTSWENYYRYDTESAAEQAPRAINTLILRAGGTAVPANAGAGFLFDNFSLTNDTVVVTPSSTSATTTVHVADLDPGPNATALTNGSGKWFMYNDSTDEIDNTLGFAQVGPATAPAGAGSFGFILAASPSDRKDLATYAYDGTPLSEITKLSYSAYSHSGIAGAAESPYFVMNVDFTGNSGSWQKRLVYVPANNGSVPQDAWNTFDMIAGGSGMWVYSGTNWPATLVGPDAGATEAGTVARSWSDIRADYPSIRILPTGGLIGVRVGEPGPSGYQGDVDNIVITTDDGTTATTTAYDFEPTLSSDLSITKTVDKSSVSVGDTVTYTLTAANSVSSDDAYKVSVSDILPAGLTFVATSSADTVGMYDSGTGVWTVGALAASSSATLHITATVGSGAAGTTVTNSATISDAHSTDPATSDNSASASFSVQPTTSGGGGGGGGGGGNGPIVGTFGTSGGSGSTAGAGGSAGSGGSSGGGSAAACTAYVSTFLRADANNDPEQVRHLQEVLTLDGETVAVTGVFDDATVAAVKAFQTKYAARILAPWGVTQPTGYVYLTTRQVLDEVYCHSVGVFPLTTAEQRVITAYRNGQRGGSVPSGQTSQVPVSQPVVTTPDEGTQTPETHLEVPQNEGQVGAAAAATGGIFQAFGNFFRHLFGR